MTYTPNCVYNKSSDTKRVNYYLGNLKRPENALDSTYYFDLLADICQTRMDFAGYIKYRNISDKVSLGQIIDQHQEELKDIEEKYDNQSLLLDRVKMTNKLYVCLLILFFLAALLIAALYFIQEIKKQNGANIAEIENLQKRQKVLMQELQLANQGNKIIHEEAKSALQAQLAVITEITEKVKMHDTHVGVIKVIFGKYQRVDFEVGNLSDDFWKNLVKAVDGLYNGIFTDLSRKCQHIGSQDKRFFCLVAYGFSNKMIAKCMNYTNVRTVSNRKSTIMKALLNKDINIDAYIADFDKCTDSVKTN